MSQQVEFHPRMLKLLTEEERVDYKLTSTLSIYGHFEADETILRLLESLAVARWERECYSWALEQLQADRFNQSMGFWLDRAPATINARLDAKEGE